MGAQTKKKSRSFSMTDEEFDQFSKRALEHRFERTEYLLALVEADAAIPMEIELHPQTKAKVLRPGKKSKGYRGAFIHQQGSGKVHPDEKRKEA